MLLLTQGKVYHEYYSGQTLSGAPIKNWTVNGVNFNKNDQTNFWGPVTDNISAKIIFFLKSPYSGTINMKVRYDDGFGLWVNDAVKFEPVWGSGNVQNNFDLNLVKGQLYSFYSEWCQGWCGFYYALDMNYPGFSNSEISSSDLFLQKLVGASPYNINITNSICGDGFRTGIETWDDGNKNNGDGWSSTCSIENGFSCKGGNSTSKDNWTLKSIYLDAILTVQILSMIWVWANSLSSLLNMSSPTGVFTIINQFQLLFLIVVSGAYLSEGVLELIIGMKIVLLNFNITFIDGIRLTENKVFNYISYDQPNKHLYDIGIIYGSTFLNISKLIIGIVFTICWHTIFALIYNKCKKIDKNKCSRKFADKLYALMAFAIYVRLIIQSFLLIVFSSFSETYELKVDTTAQIISFSINIIFIIFISVFMVWCIWQVKKAHPVINPLKQFYLTEFFSELKHTSLSRLNPIVFLGQRIISWALVIFFADVNLTAKLSILTAIQFIHLAYLLAVRPFEKVKNLIYEWVGQIVIVLFSSILIKYGTKSEWNEAINTALFAIVICATLLLTIMNIIDLIITIIKKIKSIFWSKKQTEVQHFSQAQGRPQVSKISILDSQINDLSNKIEENKSYYFRFISFEDKFELKITVKTWKLFASFVLNIRLEY